MSRGTIRVEMELYLECDVEDEKAEELADSLANTLAGSTHCETIHISYAEVAVK